ncbi:unnamed protein product [Closterium sp. Yama58-4]|nr:unnamed protein product [Closterium sp. Yama58-4]
MGSENGHSGQFRAPHLPPSCLSTSSSTSSSVSAVAAPPAFVAANTASSGSGVWGADMHPSTGEFPQSFSSQHSALPVAPFPPPFPAPLAARMFPAQSIYRPDFTQSDRYYPAAASRWGGGAFASGDDYYDGIAEENEGEWAEDALDTYIDSLDNRDGGALGPGYYYDGPAAACNEDMELEPPASATFNWTQIEESCQRMEEQHMRIMEVDLTCIGDGNGGEQVLYEFTFEETDDYAAAAAAAADDDGDSGAADGTVPAAAAAAAAAPAAVAAAGAGNAAAGGDEKQTGGGDELPWLSSEAKTAQGSIKQRVFGSATGRWRRSKGPRLQRCNSLT